MMITLQTLISPAAVAVGRDTNGLRKFLARRAPEIMQGEVHSIEEEFAGGAVPVTIVLNRLLGVVKEVEESLRREATEAGLLDRLHLTCELAEPNLVRVDVVPDSSVNLNLISLEVH